MDYHQGVRLASLGTIAVAVWMLVIASLFALDIWREASHATVVALAVVDGVLVGLLLALYGATIWLSSGRSGAASAVKKNMPSLMGLLLIYFVVLHLVVPAQTYPVYATRGYSMASTTRPANVLVALNWQNNQIFKITAYLVALVLASQTLFAAKRAKIEHKGGECAMATAAEESSFLGSTGENVRRRAL